MSTKDKDRELWLRVKQQLRALVGEEVYVSWFGSMDLDAIDGDTVRMSVPTRFLKSWINSHYTEKVLACWRAEVPSARRIEITVRTAVLRDATVKAKTAEPAEAPREIKNGAERNDTRGAMLPAQAAH